MAVDVQIEGVSYITATPNAYMVDLKSVDIDQDIAVQQTEARFDVRIWGTYDEVTGTWTWPIARPKAGNEVVFLNAAGEREFGGVLVDVIEEDIQPNVFIYHCQAGDYSKWFDRHLVNATYEANTTAQQLIADVVASYVNTPGNTRTFTTNGVQQNPQMPLPILQFVYLPPSQVLGQLVQMLGWGFYIDFYRDVQFFAFEYFTSPLPNNVLDADDLFLNPQLAAGDLPNWVNLQLGEDTSQLKNRVYITGIYVAQSVLYDESFTTDGTQTMLTLGYQPPNDVANITVDVGGTFYAIALDLVDGGPGGPCEANTAYVNFSAQTVRFCTPPAKGTVITVSYYPMLQTVVMVQNAQAQAFMAARDGTDGVYEYNRMDPSLSAELPSLAQTRAGMTITKYAYPYKPSSFTSFTSGWRVGQNFTFKSKRRMQGDFDGLSCFVTRVTKKIIQAIPGGDWLWQYDIQFANVPYEF